MQMMFAVGAIAIAALGVTIWILRRQEVFMRQRIVAVEAAEAEVRRLLDELPEAVLLVNADGVVLSTNAAALAMFDLSRRELVDTHLVDLASGEDHVRLGAAIQRAFEGDDVDPIQLEMHTGNRRTVVTEGSFHLPRRTIAADDRRLVVRLRDVSDASSNREHSTRLAAASSRRSSRRRPAWRSSASTTAASSTPISRWRRCCGAT